MFYVTLDEIRDLDVGLARRREADLAILRDDQLRIHPRSRHLQHRAHPIESEEWLEQILLNRPLVPGASAVTRRLQHLESHEQF